MYGIREPVILCLRPIRMVSGNLATNSSGHTVPKSDMYVIREPVMLCLRQIRISIREPVILCLRQIVIVLGNRPYCASGRYI